MKHQKDILNKMLPADDLYWDDLEQKYIALSPDEISDIIAACLDNAMEEESEIMSVLNWCTHVRIGELLMKQFINNNIAIVGIDENGEPIFTENKNGNI